MKTRKIESIMIHMVGKDIQLLMRDTSGADQTVTGYADVQKFFNGIKLTPQGIEYTPVKTVKDKVKSNPLPKVFGGMFCDAKLTRMVNNVQTKIVHGHEIYIEHFDHGLYINTGKCYRCGRWINMKTGEVVDV